MADSEQARKFKEALDRKNAQAQKGAAHLDGMGKSGAVHGSESHQQQFRRKSG